MIALRVLHELRAADMRRVTARLLCDCSVIALRWLRDCYVVTTVLLRRCSVSTASLARAAPLRPTWLLYDYYGIALWALRHLRGLLLAFVVMCLAPT